MFLLAAIVLSNPGISVVPVSYTHLDVYKRQVSRNDELISIPHNIKELLGN